MYAEGVSETPHEPDEGSRRTDGARPEEDAPAGLGLAGLPRPAVFSPAAFDAEPGEVCGPDGC